MNKITRPILFAVFALMLIGILGALYWKTQPAKAGFHTTIGETLLALNQLESQWSLEVLRPKADANKGQDPTAGGQRSISEMRRSLVDFDFRLEDQDRYREYLLAYSAILLLVLGCACSKLLQSFRIVQQANNSLKVANDTLEQKVEKRTGALSRALEKLKESQCQLIQSEKMASLGQMVAGVAHEINTPLAYVKSGLEIVRTRIDDISELVDECTRLSAMLESGNAPDELLAHQLQRVSDIAAEFSETEAITELGGLMKDGLYGIDQISAIVVNLKDFSRIDRDRVAEFNVNEGLESTLLIATNLVKRKKVRKLFGKVPPVSCSPSQINQVFLNLIANAVQATGDDGGITLVTKRHGDHVLIEVIDNGEGIPAEVLPKIFDPFFTTKGAGEGTGLGLSIARRIVKEHGGKIAVHSRVGVGTKFSVLLPVHRGDEEIEIMAA